jgi:hypothetical protein
MCGSSIVPSLEYSIPFLELEILLDEKLLGTTRGDGITSRELINITN